jgi:hypothetical protein
MAKISISDLSFVNLQGDIKDLSQKEQRVSYGGFHPNYFSSRRPSRFPLLNIDGVRRDLNSFTERISL